MVLCKCQKVDEWATELYCCMHKAPVCGDCICLPEHSTCEVRTYAEWIADTSCTFLPKCSLCLQILRGTSDSVTRLGCLHVLHTSCLLILLKGCASPTGYKCPSCKSEMWPTKRQFVSSGSILAKHLEELFAKSYIAMLDKNALLPLASELLPNLSDLSGQGIARSLSADRTTVFSLSSPLAEIYKDQTIEKVPLNCILNDLNPLKNDELTFKSSTMTDIEAAKSSFPAIATAEPVGSPKRAMVFSRKCSFRGDKKIIDGPAEDCGKSSKHTPNGLETEYVGSFIPCSTPAKLVLPITSPTYKTTSKSHGMQDAADGLWQRYKRAALIDPRKILLLFATLSSMGTMILIYLTLQSEKFVFLFT